MAAANQDSKQRVMTSSQEYDVQEGTGQKSQSLIGTDSGRLRNWMTSGRLWDRLNPLAYIDFGYGNLEKYVYVGIHT